MTALIGWVYVMREIVADYSENPFQGMANEYPCYPYAEQLKLIVADAGGERSTTSYSSKERCFDVIYSSQIQKDQKRTPEKIFDFL